MLSYSKFNSAYLIAEEKNLAFSSFSLQDSVKMGLTASALGLLEQLPLTINIRIGDWIVYHCALPKSKPENEWWIESKARVVMLKHHSTLYEQISANESGINWFEENNVSERNYAIHGGGLPLITDKDGFVGALVISGLSQIEDHLFGVRVLKMCLDHVGRLL
jgi:uncharacterized protein (UPF0303 family)